MAIFNYKKICLDILEGLSSHQKEVIVRRFGFDSVQRETLDSIGKSFGVTRERIRQIEKDAILKIKSKLNNFGEVFQYLEKELKKSGNLRKEDVLFSLLAEKEQFPYLFFLFSLKENFKRFPETKETYSLWTTSLDSLDLAKKIINDFSKKLKEIGTPVPLEKLISSFKSFSEIKNDYLLSYLEISKIIQKNQDNLYGLREWPEINPRNIRDKAYLIFKREKKPLHFNEISQLIGPNALTQTVHNELIKDPRFVLVGRGMYALKEWGYEEGFVKDIILKVLKEAKRPLTKEEIVNEVLKQRFVKKSTVLLNLSNKKYFLKLSEGKYTFQKA